MKNRIIAGLVAVGISTAVLTISAEARCDGGKSCGITHSKTVVPAKKKTRKTAGKVAHLSHKRSRGSSALAISASHGSVVAMIKTMAPRYGVPTWFALRIAKVESGYNPYARGSAGELGVFQMKCATARGIGFRGNCSGLLNASTGVTYGLKHLSLALRSSGGNLKLAASKHNGGLGRKSLVPRYVAMVF